MELSFDLTPTFSSGLTLKDLMNASDLVNCEKSYVRQVSGWVKTVRSSSATLYFCKINDGSTSKDFQIVLNTDNFSEDDLNEFSKKTQTGAFLKFEGYIVSSPAKGQKWEMNATSYEVIGDVADGYPLSKGKMNLDTLRNYYHLRPRTNTFSSVFRMRSNIIFSLHKFLHERGFIHVDPNIITVNECEGGAGVFQITEKEIDKQSGFHKWEDDHFEKKVFLTVSSQLNLEPFCMSMGNVYTMNKSFRSEHSNTAKHASEFTHLEIEMLTEKMSDIMDIGIGMVSYVAKKLLEECEDDIDSLDSFSSKGIKDRIKYLTEVDKDRYIISYEEAIKMINDDLTGKKCIDIVKKVEKQCGGKMSVLKMGDDLSSIYETYLTTKLDGPVFLTHFPFEQKSFYMRRTREKMEMTDSFDLLMPFGVGELIGGSMREDDLKQLETSMEEKGIAGDSLEFYKDLRRFGSAPHGGFGLGVDRLIMLMTGMQNIRDVIPIPVCYKQCKF